MIDIQRAFRSVVAGNAVVEQIAGDRIWANTGIQEDASDSTDAHIIYHLVSKRPERHMVGPIKLAESRIQIDCYARSYSVVQSLAQAVTESTDGYRGNVTTTEGSLRIRNVRFDSWEESFEAGNTASDTGWHRVSMDFLIWHEHQVPLFVQ